jgi:hypothetical protein
MEMGKVNWRYCQVITRPKRVCRGCQETAEQSILQSSQRLNARMYEHQDPWLKAMFPCEYSYYHLRFFRTGDTERKLAIGELWAIPQGGDVLRQHTASGLFCDEGAFQPDLEATIRAAMPMLKGGGRIDIVSSAEPSYFQEMVEGRAK